jgi:hypothetical protein
MEASRPKNSDSLFIGYEDGTVKQCSIRCRKVIKGFGKVTGEGNYGLRTTADKRWLFAKDYPGS